MTHFGFLRAQNNPDFKMATVESPSRAAKERTRKRKFRRKQAALDAEIGPPPITKAQRKQGDRLREAIWDNLYLFDTEVFPNSSGLKPYGDIQKESIEQDFKIITEGGRIVRAEPRGYTKTTRTANHALFGVLTGRRRMVPVFSANLEKSKEQIMARWKAECLSNEQLFWMFPDLIWPLRALENKSQRCQSQVYNGRPTYTKWKADRIVFPHIPGITGSGAILIALPLKSCRGATHTMPDGTILRPDLLIFDDVQKDEDAANPKTVTKLRSLIKHSAMMLGGHSKTMSAIMNATVRDLDDLTEQFLADQSWRRVRYKMLVKPALREKELWLGKYAEIRRNFDQDRPDDQLRAKLEALEFYKAHRAEMDEGAEASWEWGYAWDDEVPTEISAVQHAYNILIDDGEEVFASECQNEPIRDTGGLTILKPSQIKAKFQPYRRNVVPPEVTKVVSFIDPHPQILYWQVWAWEPRFTGYCIDYGTFPNQRRRSFSHDATPIRLDLFFKNMDDNARITAALEALIEGNEELDLPGLMRREWVKTDGQPLKVARCGIDANGTEADAIKKYIRQSDFASLLTPTFGRGIGASSVPMSQWDQSRKSNDGPEWVKTKGHVGDPPGITFDTNFWKTSFYRALALERGSQGAIYLFKVDNPEEHDMIAAHWYSEIPREVWCGSRCVYEFPKTPIGDNHKFDVAVGARVMASKEGITSARRPPPKKKRLTLEEMLQKAQQ